MKEKGICIFVLPVSKKTIILKIKWMRGKFVNTQHSSLSSQFPSNLGRIKKYGPMWSIMILLSPFLPF
jgi:hypothetical protein